MSEGTESDEGHEERRAQTACEERLGEERPNAWKKKTWFSNGYTIYCKLEKNISIVYTGYIWECNGKPFFS